LTLEERMYVPAHFAEADLPTLHALMRERPLGTWIAQDAGELVVNHIPFVLDPGRGEYGTLVGHVARANPVWKSLSRQLPAVVVFQGSQAYISPSWYPSKQEGGKVVPTWNYVVAHAHGIPRVVEERARLLEIVTALTDVHEAGQAVPWQVADAPADFIDKLLAAIVGIEIPITRLSGKWKASQNRPQADRQGAAAGLEALGTDEADGMAQAVRRHDA
jgi:transcriptional regulator